MTIAECNQLKQGDPIWISEGRGWRREATFLKMIEVTSFGRMTLSDLMRKDFDLGKGRKSKDAYVEYVDDNGRTKKTNVNPRRVSRRDVHGE